MVFLKNRAAISAMILRLCVPYKRSFWKWEKTEESLDGKYFWASDMILIEDLKIETLMQVIDDMIDDGSFFKAFCLITKDED